jgi:hypothetical protein
MRRGRRAHQRQCALAGQRGRARTWNLPQIWRTGHADDAKLLAALATPACCPNWRPPKALCPGKAEDAAATKHAAALPRADQRHHPTC